MDAKQVFDRIMAAPFSCSLEREETHDWALAQIAVENVLVEMVFDGEVDRAQVALTAEIVNRLVGLNPQRANRFVVKCHVAVDGVIRVHNLCPTDAVALTSDLARNWGFPSQYHGGDERFANTLFVSVEEVAS